jgi:DMSO/TMAO reductase YedYZ heme-binding membrane subunit
MERIDPPVARLFHGESFGKPHPGPRTTHRSCRHCAARTFIVVHTAQHAFRLKRRRALGLYSFMYATIHVLIFLDLDYGFAWSLIIQSIVEKPYIIFGLITFLMLTPLAITSFNIWKVRLKKNWKRLHQTIYFIAPLAVLHFALSKKGDIFHLQGDIVRPFIYGVVVLILLALRIPTVRKGLSSFRSGHLLPFFRRLQSQKSANANTAGAD